MKTIKELQELNKENILGEKDKGYWKALRDILELIDRITTLNFSSRPFIDKEEFKSRIQGA